MRTFKQHLMLAEVRADKSFEKYGQIVLLRLCQQYDYMPDGLANRLWKLTQIDFDGEKIRPTRQNLMLAYSSSYQNHPIEITPGADKKFLEAVFNAYFEYLTKEVDPAGGKYTLWILDVIANEYGNFHLSDMDRLHDSLSAYHSLKQKKFWTKDPSAFEKAAKAWDSDIPTVIKLTQNIGFFQKVHDLEEFIELTVGKNYTSDKLQKYVDNGGVTIIAQNDKGYVLKLNTVDASVGLYRGPTRWCTARPGNSYFERYSADAPLIVLSYKPLELLLQGHVTTTKGERIRPMEIQILDQSDLSPSVDLAEVDDSLLVPFCKAIGLTKEFVLAFTESKSTLSYENLQPNEISYLAKSGKISLLTLLLRGVKLDLNDVVLSLAQVSYVDALHNGNKIATILAKQYTQEQISFIASDIFNNFIDKPSGNTLMLFLLKANLIQNQEALEPLLKSAYANAVKNGTAENIQQLLEPEMLDRFMVKSFNLKSSLINPQVLALFRKAFKVAQ